MADLDVSKVTTTDLSSTVDDFSVASQTTDRVEDSKETRYSFPNATKHLGYFKEIPELRQAILGLKMWTVGKGYTFVNPRDEVRMRHIAGWGQDNFQTILENLFVMVKVFGDAFAEIIRNQNGTLINLKPISPEVMTIVVDSFGMIKRYEEVKGNKITKYQPEEIFHLCNERIGSEIHGSSVIESCQWVIDARNEIMNDYRKVLHRNVIPVRIIEIDEDDTTKRNTLKTEYATAIDKGEVLILPKGTAEVKDSTITIQDPSTFIQYLENFFYQAVGVPKIILGGSEQFTEASSKVGYLTFEQVYAAEQRKLELAILNQLGVKLKFNRPISLKEPVQDSEQKDTSQVGFQPNDTQAGRGEDAIPFRETKGVPKAQ